MNLHRPTTHKNNLIAQKGSEKIFVLWKGESVNDRLTKIPYSITHGKASSTDCATWASYEDAYDIYKRFRGSYAGIGIVLTPQKTLLGIDLDKVVNDGVIIDGKSARLVEAANTYCEISPSGTGLHLFLEIAEPLTLERNRKKIGDFTYEAYTENRYFTVTEKPFGESKPIRTVTPHGAIELLQIIGYPWNEIQVPPKPNDSYIDITIEPQARIDSANDYHRDDGLLTMMFGSKYGADIKSAWHGTLNNDKSANDYALIKHLAYWTQHDKQRVKRLFLASPSGERDKAKREDYFDRTYDAAIKSLGGKRLEFAAPRVETTQGRATQNEIQREPSIDDLLLNAHLNAAGNGDCFAEIYKNRVIYEVSSKKWLEFDDERWRYDDLMQCNRYARETAQRRYGVGVKISDLERRKRFASFCISSETPVAIEQTLKAASIVGGMQTSIDKFDNNRFLACAGKHTIDLNSREVYMSKRDDMITRKLGAKFDGDADCPRWRQFIDEIFDKNADLINYVQKAIAYSLTGDTEIHKIFLCLGDGCNGKSKFLNVLERVFGEYASSVPFSIFDADERHNNAQQELYELRGRRFVAIIESKEDAKLNESLVKAVTGGDEITARKLYCEPVKFRPQFKCWLAMNHKPRIIGIDRGIWRRIVVIQFNQNFEGREEAGLEARLLSESSGILNWILQGLEKLQSEGLKEPESIAAAVQQYRNEQDLTTQWLEDCARLDQFAKTQSSKAFQSFMAWAQSSNIRTAISQTKFSLMLQKSGFEMTMSAGRKFISGFEIISEQ